MSKSEYQPSVPGDWFVDPVRLGMPGIRSAIPGEDDNPLAWQTDALCAQTDPEAFFPEKGGSTREAKKICVGCDVRAEGSGGAVKLAQVLGCFDAAELATQTVR